jgi:hypothetical protein
MVLVAIIPSYKWSVSAQTDKLFTWSHEPRFPYLKQLETEAMKPAIAAMTITAIPHYHPTLAKIWTYPAEELAEQV